MKIWTRLSRGIEPSVCVVPRGHRRHRRPSVRSASLVPRPAPAYPGRAGPQSHHRSHDTLRRPAAPRGFSNPGGGRASAARTPPSCHEGVCPHPQPHLFIRGCDCSLASRGKRLGNNDNGDNNDSALEPALPVMRATLYFCAWRQRCGSAWHVHGAYGPYYIVNQITDWHRRAMARPGRADGWTADTGGHRQMAATLLPASPGLPACQQGPRVGPAGPGSVGSVL